MHFFASGLTLEEMTAQAFVFFAAGFETAASTTSFCLYELAKNQEVQEKLRQEIEDKLAEHGGQLSYQALQDMKYMDQVVDGQYWCIVLKSNFGYIKV